MRDELVVESIEEGIKGLFIGVIAGVYLERGLGAPFGSQLAWMFGLSIFLIIGLYFLKKSKAETLEKIEEDS